MRTSSTGIGILLCMATALGGVSATGCGSKLNFVKTDATLGKVVVYRNGVAYFERRATLDGNELRLKVPKDKINDFLKSLTIRDAETGESLPVSFPRKGTETSDVVDMVIRLPIRHGSDVILTYITDSPAWKPSYRIVVNDDGNVQLEGWAIVDNTSGENWNDVVIGVGSSSALSFRYDLWSVRDVHRQTLATQDHFAVAPPQGASTHGASAGAGSGNLITEFSDGDINRPPTHPDRPAELARVVREEGLDDDDDDDDDMDVESVPNHVIEPMLVPQRSQGSRSRRSAESIRKARIAAQNALEKRKRAQHKFSKNQSQLRAIASHLKSSKRGIVIEGLAAMNESDHDARALDRANVFRNQLINEGVAPAQIQVRSGGAQEGRPAGIRILRDSASTSAVATDENKTAPPVGESHFQSKSPMTVSEGSSVMVSIVKESTGGNIVYLYDSESSRGNSRFAFKAVRFQNPTKNTLETGPVTVYGADSFIGEGLTDPIPPNAMAMVPFALDRQVVVERENTHQDKISRLTKIERGILTTEVQHIRETRLTFTNRLQKPATVYVRHSVRSGWELLRSPKHATKETERLGEAYIFPIEVGAGASKEIVIEEATPMTKTLDLRSPSTLDIVGVYLTGASIDKELAEKLQRLMKAHRTIQSHQTSIASIRTRLGDYRVRMDELHVQIVSLKAVKSGGPLLKHLQAKMQDISTRVQTSTIQLVEDQERLMLAKIRFQDGVAELSL